MRTSADRTFAQLAPLTNGLPADGYDAGTFYLKGHLVILIGSASRFYTVDLAPNSAAYMKPVDPANGFAEQIGDFGTALNAPLEINGWAFNQTDGFIYGVRSAEDTACH